MHSSIVTHYSLLLKYDKRTRLRATFFYGTIMKHSKILKLAKKAGIKFSPAQFSGVLEAEISEYDLANFVELLKSKKKQHG